MTDINKAVEAMLRDWERADLGPDEGEPDVHMVFEVVQNVLCPHFETLEKCLRTESKGEIAPLFDELMKLWPAPGRKRTHRPRGRASLQIALGRVTIEELTSAVRSFAESPEATKERGQYCPGLNVWLAGEKWREYLPGVKHNVVAQFSFQAVEKEWDRRVQCWTEQDEWDTDLYGPRPTHPATQVPPFILARYKIETDPVNG